MKSDYHKQNMQILEVEYHRNGISGIGFYVIRFLNFDTDPAESGRFLAILHNQWDDQGEELDGAHGYCAVLKEGLGGAIDITSCWRGDRFEEELRNFLRWREDNFNYTSSFYGSGYPPISEYYAAPKKVASKKKRTTKTKKKTLA